MKTEDHLARYLAEGDYEGFEAASAEADAALAARRARLHAPEALARTARWYADHGMAIFPLSPGTKVPALRNPHAPGSPERSSCRGECGQLGHGLWDATTDVEQVELWWQSNMHYNIGYATGRQYDVLDVDGPTGFQSMGVLRENDRLPPIVGRAWTPGNRSMGRHAGLHLYTPASGVTNGAGVGPGLDIRGAGGYVVLPPSRIDGRLYEWAEMVQVE